MMQLAADQPSSLPTEDMFGHIPFAESLANSIYCYSGNDD